MDTLERINNKIDIDFETGCWNWTGSQIGKGYGQCQHIGNTRYAHRAVYQLLVGPVPSGLELDHLCCNLLCVNPDHLEPVTHLENVKRWAERRRQETTHCPRGHEYTPENTFFNTRGTRCCRTCRGWQNLGSGHQHAIKTHCPQGHEYDAGNTYVSPNGSRQCRTCRMVRERQKRHRLRNLRE